MIGRVRHTIDRENRRAGTRHVDQPCGRSTSVVPPRWIRKRLLGIRKGPGRLFNLHRRPLRAGAGLPPPIPAALVGDNHCSLTPGRSPIGHCESSPANTQSRPETHRNPRFRDRNQPWLHRKPAPRGRNPGGNRGKNGPGGPVFRTGRADFGTKGPDFGPEVAKNAFVRVLLCAIW
jgi:hypothetical protein